MHLVHPSAASPWAGVCVVRVEACESGPALVTVTVVLDVVHGRTESASHFLDGALALEVVSDFLLRAGAMIRVDDGSSSDA